VPSRRGFLAQSAWPLIAARGSTGARPNILWISCEDTGPQLGCYGDPHAVTPTLDRLASQGVRYTRAHTVAGVCAPSRSGIITGMYPSTLGSQYMRCRIELPEFVHCFPEYLRRAGYYCTNNSKTDYNFLPPAEAWDESSNKAHWRKRAKGQPFFSVFNILCTHEGQVRLRGAAYAAETARLKSGERQDPARLPLPPYYPDTPESRRDWANYYELITAMDYQAGDRLRELEQDGLLDDTIVFFWGDHGVGLPRAKRWVYEASTHVPLIVRVPEKFRAAGQGVPASADPRLVSFIDLAPTVLNLAGIEVPSHMQGQPFLGPKLPAPRRHIFAARDRMDERYDLIRAVSDGRYRYIRNFQPWTPWAQPLHYAEQGNILKEMRRLSGLGKLTGPALAFMADRKPVEELYDVHEDPWCIRNLAGAGAHRDTAARLGKALDDWMMGTRDLGLIPEPVVAERGSRLGSRHAILRQPGAEDYLRRLRAVVDKANRGAAAEAFAPQLRDPDEAVRYWAVVGMADRPVKPIALLREAMRDPSAVVRVAAARAVGDSGAVAILETELGNSNEWLRLRAAIALDELRVAGEAMRNAARDTNEYVRRIAAHATAPRG
jgi:N-sulfoglucosamine sulfohydrolase